jgi:hypothetical protein
MSATDLAIWNVHLMSDPTPTLPLPRGGSNDPSAAPRLPDPGALASMTTRGILDTGEQTQYGLGLFIGKTASGRRRWWHSGGTAGFVSRNAVYPDDRVAITVLTNGEGDGAARIFQALETILIEPETEAAAAAAMAAAGRIFAALQDGRIERDLLSADALAYFTPEAVQNFQMSLGPLGPATSFVQTASGERGGMTMREYRVQTGPKALTVSAFVDKAGKFVQFMVYGQMR